MQRFTNKVVLVTGAASGIGRAAVERFATEGAIVFCVDLQAAELKSFVASLQQRGTKAEAFVCDVSDEASVKACVAKCLTSFGRIDVLCNMAGILRFAYAHETSMDVYNLVMKVNVASTFLLCREALPALMKSKGNIVNCASSSVFRGLPWAAAYVASKGAILAMTKSLAVDYGQYGVRANCVAPGDVITPIATHTAVPEGADFQAAMLRIASVTGAKGPETVAGSIALLASDDAIHITGECIVVDGGQLA